MVSSLETADGSTIKSLENYDDDRIKLEFIGDYSNYFLLYNFFFTLHGI